MIASEFGLDNLVEVLLADMDPNSENGYGQTALHLAGQNGFYDTFSLLLHHGVDIYPRDGPESDKIRVLEHIFEKGYRFPTRIEGHCKMIELMLDRQKDPKLKLLEARRVLKVAAFYKYVAVVLEKVEGMNLDVEEALSEAINQSRDTVIQQLLDSRLQIRVNWQDGTGRSLLHCAADSGNVEFAQYLLHRGADVNLQEHRGLAALHFAAKLRHANLVQILLENGADVELKSKEGWTALHEASKQGAISSARQLLDNGAAIDFQDNSGRTALHHAVKEVEVGFVLSLLDKGAAIGLKDTQGRRAIDLAYGLKLETLVKMIKERQAGDPKTRRTVYTLLALTSIVEGFDKHRAALRGQEDLDSILAGTLDLRI